VGNWEIYCLAEEISDLVWSEVDRWDPFPKETLGTDAFENVVEKVQVLSPKLNGYIRRTREEIGLGQTKAPPRLAEPEANYSVLAGAEEDPQIG